MKYRLLRQDVLGFVNKVQL